MSAEPHASEPPTSKPQISRPHNSPRHASKAHVSKAHDFKPHDSRPHDFKPHVSTQHPAALDNADVRLLEAGAHAFPFRVLGVHGTDHGRQLRVNAPGAWRVEARDRPGGRVLAVLNQSQSPGLFVGDFGDERSYALRIYWPGRIEDGADPYAFCVDQEAGELARLRDGRGRGVGDLLGARLKNDGEAAGTRFAFFAPEAASVALVGDFNGWDDRRHPMQLTPSTGAWRLFVPGVGAGARYAFAVRLHPESAPILAADPFARRRDADDPGRGVVCDPLAAQWRDARWLAMRRARRAHPPPRSIYRMRPEVWLGDDGARASWAMLAERAPAYLSALGFTHLQLGAEPGDWLFAPPARLGAPEDFAAFVDACHDAGVGVILEWDGARLFADGGLSPQWAALRQNAAVDSAMFWFEAFHVDGLSLPAAEGATGELLSRVRAHVEESAPGGRLYIEEASLFAHGYATMWARELINAPESAFGWDEANADILAPLTPDTLAAMPPGPEGLAALRAALAEAWMLRGAKLLHMGAELAQTDWTSGRVEWERLERRECLGVLRLVRDLNAALRAEAPVRLTESTTQETRRIAAGDDVFAFLRTADGAAPLLTVRNRLAHAQSVTLPAPQAGVWRELINTDSMHYCGSNIGNCGLARARTEHGAALLDIILPPHGALILRADA